MHCHESSQHELSASGGTIALIGQPNVGKSVLFQRLTGQHVTVSNYPGTTVEIARGTVRDDKETILLDTPGVIAFPPHTEDEQVTERVLLAEPIRAILQVGDAKNLRRTLLLTLQLAEMGLPLVLALNMMDEADARGVVVDHILLAEHLNLTVIPTTATRGRGVSELKQAIQTSAAPQFRINYTPEIETTIAQISARIPGAPISSRSLALLWLSSDPVTEDWLHENLNTLSFQELLSLREVLQSSLTDILSAVIQRTRLAYVDQIANAVLKDTGKGWGGFSTVLGRLTTHPVWGWFFLAIVLFGLFWFVGVFGAGYMVDLLEARLFNEIINPWVIDIVNTVIPIPLVVDFLVGDFGLWTMGITYALALILPIVTTFFLAFGIMEDSGYLPRLAALSNRLFKSLGLNGKAVLPMVLGLGCVTMATLTTRVLETKRERILATLLLALAVPCSAQLGVVMGMLAGISLAATIIWGSVVFIVMLAIGWLAARLMPGERTKLLIELPPLRTPMFSNVLIKTLARLEWYLKEVLPLFLLGAAIMFALDKSGVLSWLIQVSEPLVTGWLGLPAESSAAFIMGFIRRDFGATGFFVMESEGLLTAAQVVVAMVVITLFIPCLASVMMIGKERGWKTALGILILIIPLAFLIGGILYRVLLTIGWGV
ncbi:MAG: ferrous iron transport protein B [Anaerolineales bacterium]|nr:ferrous iron transport protein B [Anaerolineales bacterium]